MRSLAAACARFQLMSSASRRICIKVAPLSSYRSSRVFVQSSVPLARGFVTSAARMAEKDWSASQYLKFEAERTRPSRDLLSQVPLKSPSRIVDLGCGPGNSTEVLAKYYPEARVSGMDSSPDMIEKAKARLPQMEFELGDLKTYAPKEPVDLFFSNAVFQWVPHDQRIGIMKHLIETLPSGGVFAFQVPDNYHEPSHVSMRETAKEEPWSGALNGGEPARVPFQSPVVLYDELKPLCSDVNIWHTYYQHALDGHEAIAEWLKGSGLRPFIDPLSAEDREQFLKGYLERIAKAYPVQYDGKVLLRFPRLFVVAVKA